MGYKITPSEDHRHILLKVVGKIDSSSAMQQNLEAHALGRKLGINRYLVDVREARNTDTTLGNYDFAYTNMKQTQGVDVSAKVALLVSPGDSSHDFVETVCRNVGLDVTLFTDPDEALKYLSGE